MLQRLNIKESGAITLALKDVKHTFGAEREGWKFALQAELDSLYESVAVQNVDHIPHGQKSLPMKIVVTLKPIEGSILKKKKARAVVCGNFQSKTGQLVFTENTDVHSIRCALFIAAQDKTWGVSSIDVSTAFLNTPLPDEEEHYVMPPNIFKDFGLLEDNVIWKLKKAVYGLRVSPRLWGKERDRVISKFVLKTGKVKVGLFQSTVDPACWVL